MVYVSWSLLATSISLFLNRPAVYRQYFDLQGHRGGRGDAIENTLPSFAWALISGVTTLELDNGITKDGVPIVWHDEAISAMKCQDTAPAFKDDPDFPYVGKNIVNLTLAQIKTLDCGSKHLKDHPLQLRYPGTKISTLRELFKFAECADPHHRILWNIESKINPLTPEATHDVDNFVTKQHAEFLASGYMPSQITYQSFDWRTLVALKALDDRFPTSALVCEESLLFDADGKLPWLAGFRLEDFPGSTMGAQIANAAKFIKADVLSPAAFYWNGTSHDPSLPGYIPFITKDMIDHAHKLGMTVIPWTVNRLNIADQLVDWGVDGIITDYPNTFNRWAESRNLKVAPKYSKKEVLSCLEKHLQRD